MPKMASTTGICHHAYYLITYKIADEFKDIKF